MTIVLHFSSMIMELMYQCKLVSLIEILQSAMLDDDDNTNPRSTLTTKSQNKIFVFFPVARMVSYFSAVF